LLKSANFHPFFSIPVSQLSHFFKYIVPPRPFIQLFSNISMISYLLQVKNRSVMSVVIETTVGDLTVDLFTKERRKTSLNFIKLCKAKKYNMSLFHMVQPNFIAQTGDPTGTGRGGESIFQELYGNQAR